jgi:hypothetical protein
MLIDQILFALMHLKFFPRFLPNAIQSLSIHISQVFEINKIMSYHYHFLLICLYYQVIMLWL